MTLTYSQVIPDDLEDAIVLYEKYLNAGDGIREFLTEGIMRQDYAGYKCSDNGRMVGIFSARPGVYFTYEHPELEAEIKRRWPKDIYSVDMLAVEDAYRSLGIARRVTRECCELVRQAGGKYLLMEFWRKPDGDEPAIGVLPEMGAGIIEEKWLIPDFYKDLHLYGLTCPDCGARCVCGALVGLVRL